MLLSVEKIYGCETISQALDQLSGDSGAIPLAAGTDIIPVLRDRGMGKVRLVDLHSIKELNYIHLEDGMLRIGAMTTHQAIATSEIVKKHLPALAYACSQVGSAQIRRRATIGGNICHASPAADTLPVLIAADACAVIRTREYRKTILLEKIFTGVKKTSLPQGALLEEISILLPDGGFRGNYYRLGGRKALTISISSVAVLQGTDGIHVAYGSMGPTVKRVKVIEEYLNSCAGANKTVIRELVRQSLSPISDIRASREYRLEVASNFTWLGFSEVKGL